MPANRPKRVLVTGAGGASGYSMLKSLRESPLDVELFAGDMYEYAAGFYLDGVTPVRLPAASQDPEALKEKLLAYCLDQKIDIVISSPEAEVLALTQGQKKLAKEYGIQIIAHYPESALRSINKYEMYKHLRGKNLNLPHTMLIESAEDLKKWPNGFPCVLKLIDGVSARFLHYIKTLDDLDIAYAYVSRYMNRPKILLQSMIPGPVQSVYTVGALYWQGELINAGIHHKLRTSPENGGSAIAGITAKPDHLLDYGLKILEAVGPWHGCVAVEFKISETDGQPWLLEINPRLWGFSYLMTKAGVNYPEMLVRLASGEKIETMAERGGPLPYKIGLRMANMLEHAFF